MLTSYPTMVHLPELRNSHWYNDINENIRLYLDFTYFSLVTFVVVLGFNPIQDVNLGFSCPVSLLSSDDKFEGQMVYRLSLNLGLSDAFS